MFVSISYTKTLDSIIVLYQLAIDHCKNESIQVVDLQY